jgi:regulatory protein
MTSPYDAAVRLLAVRAHSERELGDKLRRRGFDAVAIDAAMARLREHGYLDDAAFARSLVRLRAGRRSRAAMAAELIAKGIDRAIATEALADIDSDTQLDAARKLVAAWGGLAPERVAGRLQRRGFPPGVIHSVLRDDSM